MKSRKSGGIICSIYPISQMISLRSTLYVLQNLSESSKTSNLPAFFFFQLFLVVKKEKKRKTIFLFWLSIENTH
jgi:hypothetical protein